MCSDQKEKPAFREAWKVGVKQLERAFSLLEIFVSIRLGLATGFTKPSIHLPARTDYGAEDGEISELPSLPTGYTHTDICVCIW